MLICIHLIKKLTAAFIAKSCQEDGSTLKKPNSANFLPVEVILSFRFVEGEVRAGMPQSGVRTLTSCWLTSPVNCLVAYSAAGSHKDIATV